MKKLLLSAAAAIALSGAAHANELSKPIVAFTPIVAKNADTLALNAEQKVALKEWLAVMPKNRKAIEARALDARAELRMAINTGAPSAEREVIATRIGDIETELLMMRSKCTDHWREVLTEAQFAKVLDLAAAM